jgi:hypothetical protein
MASAFCKKGLSLYTHAGSAWNFKSLALLEISSTILIILILPDPLAIIFSTFWLSVNHHRVIQSVGLKLPDFFMNPNVREIANNSLWEDDYPLSSNLNSSEKENSGSPSIEYDATAKSDALLAMTALLSCSL